MKKIWYAPNRFEAYGDHEKNKVNECLDKGWLAGFGEMTVEFEERVSKLFGKEYGVFVNSGSSAILLALCVINLKKGDEVITPACGFATTVSPIIQLGATPVFCDVEPTTYVPSVESILECITEKTKCILIPNLIGNVIDWKLLREKTDLILIEDSADTITHTPYSDISTTSFYSSHLITAGGTGGMVMFNKKEEVNRCLMFRDWGRIGNNIEDVSERFNHTVDGIEYDFKFLYGALGYNMKCSEMNAAFGLGQLDRLDEIKEKRRKVFERYLERLKDSKIYTLPDDSKKPNWLAIPFCCKNRLQLLTFLEENNVQTRVCFAGNITRHPVYREYLKEFKVSDKIMAEGFLLGAHHGMTMDDVDYVCDLLIKFEKENQ